MCNIVDDLRETCAADWPQSARWVDNFTSTNHAVVAMYTNLAIHKSGDAQIWRCMPESAVKMHPEARVSTNIVLQTLLLLRKSVGDFCDLQHVGFVLMLPESDV